MNFTKKKFLTILLTLLFLIALCFIIKGYFNYNYVLKGIENYDSEQCSFSLSNIGNYDSVYYQLAKNGDFLFNSTGAMLVAEYDTDEFNKQLEALDEYKYVDGPVMFGDDKYIIPNPTFDIGNWSFKIIAYTGYPNTFDFIAINENENKIAYLTFNDQDLDYLCKVEKSNNYMQKFIKKNFKYNFYK